MPMDVYGWLHKRGTLAGAKPQTELIFVHLAAQGLDPWTCNEKLQAERSCISVCPEFWNILPFVLSVCVNQTWDPFPACTLLAFETLLAPVFYISVFLSYLKTLQKENKTFEGKK